MERHDDQELITRIKHGDIRSYEVLVKRYQQKIFSFIYRYVFDESVAEELTQDVLFRVYTTIDRIDTSRKFSSYLFQMAKNRAIDYLRIRKSTTSIDTIEISDESLSVEERLFEDETKDELMKAVNSLTEQYKRVILMYYFDDLSYEEIAKKLDIPVNTVRTHLKRGKEKLSTVLHV